MKSTLSLKSRPGSWARRRAIAERRKFLKANASSLAVFAFVITGLLFGFTWLSAAVGQSLTQRSFHRGLFIGVMIGAMGMLISVASGHYSISAGADAEVWTSRELHKFSKRGYRSIDNIEFSGFDIDHVAMGPAGVFALESKWTSHPWVLTSDGIEGPQRDPIRRAQDAAHQIHLFLNKSRRLSLIVKPVLVIWGPGKPNLQDEVTLIRGVTVLAGNEKAWAKLLDERGPLSAEHIDRAFDELRRFVKARADYEWKQSGRRLPLWASTMLRWGAVVFVGLLGMVIWALIDGPTR